MYTYVYIFGFGNKKKEKKETKMCKCKMHAKSLCSGHDCDPNRQKAKTFICF